MLTLRYFAVASFSEDSEDFIFVRLPSVVAMDFANSVVLMLCPISGVLR